MENLNEKFENFELNDEALEQVTGGKDVLLNQKHYYCPKCRISFNTDSKDVSITSSGIAKHSCGATLELRDSSTVKISPQ